MVLRASNPERDCPVNISQYPLEAWYLSIGREMDPPPSHLPSV